MPWHCLVKAMHVDHAIHGHARHALHHHARHAHRHAHHHHALLHGRELQIMHPRETLTMTFCRSQEM